MASNKVFYFHMFDPECIKGGYTLAISSNEFGAISIGVARCSLKDSYCKRTGREVALHRLATNSIAITSPSQLYIFLKDLRKKEHSHISQWITYSFNHILYVLSRKPEMFPIVNFNQEFCHHCLK